MYKIKACLPLLLAYGSLTPASAAAQSQLLWRHTPERGFIDDCLAFNTTGSKLAYVHTDSATFLRLVVVSTIPGEIGKRLVEIPLDATRIVPWSVAFTPDGERVVVSFSDATRSTQGVALLALDGAKQLAEHVGANEVLLATHRGQQVVSLVSRQGTKAGATRLTVTLHDTLGLKPIGQAAVSVGPDGTVMVANSVMRLLYWAPGYTEFVALEPGHYDREKDIRLPDHRIRFGTVEGQVLSRKKAGNALLWREAVEIRAEQPPQRRLAFVTQDLKRLQLIRLDDSVVTLKTTHPWQFYEPSSLRQYEHPDGKTLDLSLTVDPLNPTALAQKKAMEQRVDFYRLGAGDTPHLLGSAMVEKRDFSWAASSRHIAYLRKLRGFARGGKVLEVYATGEAVSSSELDAQEGHQPGLLDHDQQHRQRRSQANHPEPGGV